MQHPAYRTCAGTSVNNNGNNGTHTPLDSNAASIMPATPSPSPGSTSTVVFQPEVAGHSSSYNTFSWAQANAGHNNAGHYYQQNYGNPMYCNTYQDYYTHQQNGQLQMQMSNVHNHPGPSYHHHMGSAGGYQSAARAAAAAAQQPNFGLRPDAGNCSQTDFNEM